MKIILHKAIKTICLFSFFFSLSSAFAQAPQKMSYQAVIRNASNALVANANVGMRISVLQGTANGTAVYVETQTATTNINGLVTVEIGSGTVVSGTFASINWGTNTYFIKTETDPTGGTNYTIVGTSQFLSVPYALFASNSGSSTNNWTTTGTNIANNNSGNVGVGTGAAVPFSKFTVKGDQNAFTQENSTATTRFGVFTGAQSTWLQTLTNSDLNFATNDNPTAQMTLQKGTGNFGIGNTTPAEKLDVNGKTKTITLQVTNGAGSGLVLTSDATGNASWQTAGATAWSLTGNTGTNPANNFIGTTDNNDFSFRRFNAPAGRISVSNTSFGAGALNTASTGLYNVAVGTNAMSVTTSGGFNTATGYFSLKSNTTGGSNSAMGYGALKDNTGGSSNTATGSAALSGNQSGSTNTAMGAGALTNNVSGSENTAVGVSALSGNVSSNGSTAVGFEALRLSASTQGNTAVGSKALWSNTTGNLNVAVGGGALGSNTYGFENVAIGYSALQNVIGGSTNIAIGTGAGTNLIYGSNNIVIGAGAVPPNNSDDQIRIGNTAIDYAGVQVAWTITSDKRWKDNIQKSRLSITNYKILLAN